MDKVARMGQEERNELFRETANLTGIPEAIVEKDFWVCWVLRYLFANSAVSKDVIFKGGTSLSKVFGIIERFSEDIDLILNWKLLGIPEDEPWLERSKTKQDKYNKEVNQKAQGYIGSEFVGMMKRDFTECGIGGLLAEVDTEDAFVIRVRYPRAFERPYIRPEIRLEIGPLASWVPHNAYTIQPYAAQQFANVFNDPECGVVAINAERSFWEKATILHQEAHSPDGRSAPLRFSRHYYDLFRMDSRPVKKAALESLDLLADVAAFKIKFYPCNWARYDTAKPGTLKLVPPDTNMKSLQDDYTQMREMIFGIVPEFDEIVEVLGRLEREINGGWHE